MIHELSHFALLGHVFLYREFPDKIVPSFCPRVNVSALQTLCVCTAQDIFVTSDVKMIEELRKLVEARLVDSGLVAMVVSDLEGVPILQAQTDNTLSMDALVRFQFTSSQTAANEKCCRLGLEGHKRSLVSYQDYQVLSVTHDSVVLTVVAAAAAGANVGVMENFAKRMAPLVNDVATAVIPQP